MFCILMLIFLLDAMVIAYPALKIWEDQDFCWIGFFTTETAVTYTKQQEAQLSQRGHAMLHVTEYFAKSLKVT